MKPYCSINYWNKTNWKHPKCFSSTFVSFQVFKIVCFNLFQKFSTFSAKTRQLHQLQSAILQLNAFVQVSFTLKCYNCISSQTSFISSQHKSSDFLRHVFILFWLSIFQYPAYCSFPCFHWQQYFLSPKLLCSQKCFLIFPQPQGRLFRLFHCSIMSRSFLLEFHLLECIKFMFLHNPQWLSQSWAS